MGESSRGGGGGGGLKGLRAGETPLFIRPLTLQISCASPSSSPAGDSGQGSLFESLFLYIENGADCMCLPC